MQLLLAVDKFKGCLTSAQVAGALAGGIRAACPSATLRIAPVADGGDGTLDAAVAAGFTLRRVTASGPAGAPLATGYAQRGSTAVVELAAVCGLGRLPPADLRPWDASTFGVGELIGHAVDSGARQVIVGVGGSASTDGGAGLLQALGARITGADGEQVPRGAAGLTQARAIDLGPVRTRLAGVQVVVACDVDNPLVGPDGAALVYGPQKGADPQTVTALDAALRGWSELVRRGTGADLAGVPGAGAAGGAGFGLLAAGARLAPGAELLLDLVGFSDLLAGSSLVVTGEGSLDAQTLAGKAPARVAARAASAQIPVVAVAGRCLLDRATLRRVGIMRVYPLSDLEPDPQRSMEDARALLHRQGGALATDWLSADRTALR